MTDHDLDGPYAWHISSRCMSNSQCVETAPIPDGSGVAVRDTKDRAQGMLTFGMDDWSSFIGALKDGSLSRDG